MENFGKTLSGTTEMANKAGEISKPEGTSPESNVLGKGVEDWGRPEETHGPQWRENPIEPETRKTPDFEDWKRPDETEGPQWNEENIDLGTMRETENVPEAKTVDGAEKTSKDETGKGEVTEAKQPIENKVAGLEREKEVKKDLEEKYPAEEGYEILPETYLRDKDGNIVKDPETGEARRIDFVVVKDGKVVDSVEVTSKTADKTEQSAKEERIRDAGGNYIKDSDGNLVEIPSNVKTRIERRD